MNLPYILAAVAVMAAVTYLPRMLPLVIFRKKISNPFIRSFLGYVPCAVLAAMTFPAVFSSTASVWSAAAGAAVAFILSWKGKGLLTVALSAAGAVFLVEQLLKFLQS